MTFQPLDYTFFFVILMVVSYFSWQFYNKYERIKVNIDDGKLVEKYVLLQTMRKKYGKDPINFN